MNQFNYHYYVSRRQDCMHCDGGVRRNDHWVKYEKYLGGRDVDNVETEEILEWWRAELGNPDVRWEDLPQGDEICEVCNGHGTVEVRVSLEDAINDILSARAAMIDDNRSMSLDALVRVSLSPKIISNWKA